MTLIFSVLKGHSDFFTRLGRIQGGWTKIFAMPSGWIPIRTGVWWMPRTWHEKGDGRWRSQPCILGIYKAHRNAWHSQCNILPPAGRRQSVDDIQKRTLGVHSFRWMPPAGHIHLKPLLHSIAWTFRRRFTMAPNLLFRLEDFFHHLRRALSMSEIDERSRDPRKHQEQRGEQDWPDLGFRP